MNTAASATVRRSMFDHIHLAAGGLIVGIALLVFCTVLQRRSVARLRAMICTIMRDRKPRSGLHVIDQIREVFEHEVQLGTIHGVLRSMERDGLLTSWDSYENLAVRGGRPRRMYQVAP